MAETVESQSIRVLELDEVLARAARHTTWERGRRAMLALRPFSSPHAVLARQEEVAEAMRLDEAFTVPPLRGVREVGPAAVSAARGQVLDAAQLLDVAQAMEVAIRTRRFFAERLDSSPRLAQLGVLLVPLQAVVDDVHACLESDGQVRDSASGRLESLRIHIRTLQNRIQSRIQGILRNPAYVKMFQEPFVTLRGDRYVLPVKAEHRSQFPGLVLDASASGATVFMEPLSVVEQGNELREAQAAERHEVAQILARLSERVGAAADDLERNAEILGHLDMLMALARYAAERRCRLVAIEPEPRLLLRGARHPLLEDRAVPVDLEVGGATRILVLTGPNTGGKTVTLKTLGLLALMAMSGMPIPCREGSRVGWLDGVYADIGDEQSIQQNLSTFSAHMGQVGRILARAGDHCVVLLDEAGAGTDPREGTSLAVAILEFLHARGALVAATTHYNELKAFAASFPGACNAAMEFDPETLQPTYHIIQGLPGRSCALEIALRLGLPPAVLDRARDLLGETHFSMEDLLVVLQVERQEATRRHEMARQAHSDADAERQRQRESTQRAQTERERLLSGAARDAEELIAAAREEARTLIREARERIRALGDRSALDRLETKVSEDLKALGSATGECLEVIQERLAEAAPPADAEQPAPLAGATAVGDVVWIPRLRQEGTVESVDGNEAGVRIGRLRMTLPLRDVERRRAASGRKAGDGKSFKESGDWTYRPAGSEGSSVQRLAAVSTRLHLIGMRAEEAAHRLERYLDEVSASGVGQVTVVHGKGAGILQKVVHEVLTAHPAVASFRLGEAGEGGWGVTVATLQ